MLWTEKHIDKNPFSREGDPRSRTEKIVWHYTANPGATAMGHYYYFEGLKDQNPNDDVKDTYASAHLFIDKTQAICIIPLDEIAYHASQANPYSIGIELCIEADGSFHPNTLALAAKIGAELCSRYGLDPIQDSIRHYDVTGKICPKPFVDDPSAWLHFKQSIKGVMNMTFPDVPNDHWAHAFIDTVSDAGLMKGYPDGSFHPDSTMTRAEVAKVVNDLLFLINQK